MHKIDKNLVFRRFSKHLTTYDTLAVVQRRIAATLADYFAAASPTRLVRALEVGAGTGFFTDELLKIIPIDTLYLNDLVPEALPPLAGRLNVRHVECLPGDAEQIDLPAGLDLVFSASAVQWFNDLDGFFEKAAVALKPGGWFVFNSFGPENLYQIKALTGNGLDYLPVGDLRRLLEKRFEVVDLRRETIRQSFEAPFDVLRHLQRTGVTAVDEFRWTPGALRAFERDYDARYATDGQVFLDWDVIYAVAKFPERRSL
jgi:malonyl-CoA O-methyltransferase